MRVLITRPQDDADDLAPQLAALGVESVSAPLLEIVTLDGPDLDLDGVQALLLTSANGVRALSRRTARRDLKALCVGDATRRAAVAAGFGDVLSASGDVQTLAKLVGEVCDPHGGVLLHAAGSRVAGDLAGLLEGAGFSYRREVLYEAEKARRLPDAARAALTEGRIDGVLLYSPRTAAALVKLVAMEKLGGFLVPVTAYCLSPAVADQIADLTWREIRIAAHPDQASLLALLDDHG